MKNKILFFLIFVALGFFTASVARATTNVTSTTNAHWAWNDIIGWIDFYNTASVNVFSNRLEGYASSSAGDISLDCHTTSAGNICAQSNYQVTNDGGGNLSKWAWNDQYGWISFDCNNNGGCGASNYQVHINGNTGDFGGDGVSYAWNDTIGWISFNCSDPGICGTSQYKVNTSWLATSTTGTLDSTTYDTGVAAGAQLNSVLWHGNLPASTAVKFQFAASNSSSGPWTFVGTDGTINTYYGTGPDLSLKLNYNYHDNFRYFRYRALMLSNASNTVSPRVDDIIVNWSP